MKRNQIFAVLTIFGILISPIIFEELNKFFAKRKGVENGNKE